MTKILLRSAQDPFVVLDAEKSAGRMGGNAGNLLYANGVHRALSSADNDVRAGGFNAHRLEDPTEWLEKTNQQYDRYVIPMANAFRYTFREDLRRMTELVRQLEMPVTVVGVGAQAAAPASDDDGLVMGRTGSAWQPKPKDVAAHNRVVLDFV